VDSVVVEFAYLFMPREPAARHSISRCGDGVVLTRRICVGVLPGVRCRSSPRWSMATPSCAPRA